MSGFHLMYGGHDNATYEGRVANDSYPTPPFATFALTRVENIPHKLWEPACGRGWMSRELERLGHDVLSSDLHHYADPLVGEPAYGIDYLDNVPAFAADGVVTNPPYGKDLAEKFIRKTLRDYEYGAFLCRLTFGESAKRFKLFTETPPSRVHVFSQRFSCDESRFEKEPMGGMVAYAWWVWDRRPDGRHELHTTMHWIDTKKMLESWRKSL